MIELIGSKKIAHAQERVPRTRDLHKERKMSAVPRDAVPERRTERRSPRFWPRFRYLTPGREEEENSAPTP